MLQIDKIKKEDWKSDSEILGNTSIIKKELVPSGDWTPYDVSNEKQYRGYESFCCTNFSSTTMLEVIFNYHIKNKLFSVENIQWLHDKGYIDENGFVNFSDRFDALISGTTPNGGNSIKRVADAKRKYGLIPEKMLPWAENKTEYFNPKSITEEMYALGREFLERFQINYEVVNRKNFNSHIKYYPLAGGVHAWDRSKFKNGIWLRTLLAINHAIGILKPSIAKNPWLIKDSYPEFIKKLAWNFLFLHYAVGYTVTEKHLIKKVEGVLPAVKFEAMPAIYIKAPANPKILIWICDWEDYKSFINLGIIKPYKKEIPISLFANYKVYPRKMNMKDILQPPSLNPFGKFINKIINAIKTI